LCTIGTKETSPITKTSNLDVNTHHQKETYEDADHDLIEDYSIDKDLEAAEKEEAKAVSPKPSIVALGGGSTLFDEEDHPDGYVEERLDARGNHFRKEVHKGDGWESVSISSSSAEPMDLGEMGDIGGLIAQMM